jgi:hypothetical protein
VGSKWTVTSAGTRYGAAAVARAIVLREALRIPAIGEALGHASSHCLADRISSSARPGEKHSYSRATPLDLDWGVPVLSLLAGHHNRGAEGRPFFCLPLEGISHAEPEDWCCIDIAARCATAHEAAGIVGFV